MQNKQQISFKKFLEAKTDKVKSTLKTAETIGSFDCFQLHLLYFFFISMSKTNLPAHFSCFTLLRYTL